MTKSGALSPTRYNGDARRKATMMMCGDVYDYFWQDKGGFRYIDFIYDTDNLGGPGTYQSATGANEVKHLYENLLGGLPSGRGRQAPESVFQ